MPTLDYFQQQLPALFWGFVNPVWTTLSRDLRAAPAADATDPPDPWIVTRHQTAGVATKHLVLAGVFVTADPFPLQTLVADYESSLLGMWDDLPTWSTLQTFAARLQSAQLTMPSDDSYRWLQEAFLPVDPRTLFERGRAWSHAQCWTGAESIRTLRSTWPDFATLESALDVWQAQNIAAYAAQHCTTTEQMIAPFWYRRPLVGAVMFENSD